MSETKALNRIVLVSPFEPLNDEFQKAIDELNSQGGNFGLDSISEIGEMEQVLAVSRSYLNVDEREKEKGALPIYIFDFQGLILPKLVSKQERDYIAYFGGYLTFAQRLEAAQKKPRYFIPGTSLYHLLLDQLKYDEKGNIKRKEFKLASETDHTPSIREEIQTIISGRMHSAGWFFERYHSMKDEYFTPDFMLRDML